MRPLSQKQILFYLPCGPGRVYTAATASPLIQMTGFLFSFKMYIPKHDGELDCIENMVHHITRSDLIHVEVIPILSSCQELLYA